MLNTLFQVRLLMGLVPILGAILWWGMDSGAKYYERPPHEVRAALAHAYLPTHILGQYVKGSRVSTLDDGTVVTALIDENGAELMRFVTTVTPAGSGSEVATEVTGPQGVHAEGAQEALKTQQFAMALMRKLADEHVAAAIEGRDFDMLAFNPAAKGIAEASGHGDAFDRANADAAVFAKAEQEAFAEGESYPEESDEVAYGEPADDAAPADDWAE